MNCNAPIAGDDDGPVCHLTENGEANWPDNHRGSGEPPKNPGRWAAWILLGVIVVGVGLTLGVVAMRGGAS